MILSAQTIRKLGIFEPFCERTKLNGMSYGLSAAGYDVRVREEITLAPGGSSLASTVERFTMPLDVLGKVADKSSWARQFLTVQNTIIEPGWEGYLTLELTNHSQSTLHIPAGAPIAQIILHRLDEPTEQGYDGKYQRQASEPTPTIFEF